MDVDPPIAQLNLYIMGFRKKNICLGFMTKGEFK